MSHDTRPGDASSRYTTTCDCDSDGVVARRDRRAAT
jgi:hypothetical protein